MSNGPSDSVGKTTSDRKRKIDDVDSAIDGLVAPKPLWSSPAGAHGNITGLCSDFQNRFKEDIFDGRATPTASDTGDENILRPVEALEMGGLSVPACVEGSSTGANSVRGLQLDRVESTPHQSQPISGCFVENDIPSEIAILVENKTDSVLETSTASCGVFAYNGPTFGMDVSSRAIADAAKRSDAQATNPLNPWYLSQGIPNFAKNAKGSVVPQQDYKRARRTPDVLLKLSGSISNANNSFGDVDGNSGVSGDVGSRLEMTSLLTEEKEKAKRLEDVLFNALVPK